MLAVGLRLGTSPRMEEIADPDYGSAEEDELYEPERVEPPGEGAARGALHRGSGVSM
jgi:hypothetical protein